MLNAVAAPAPSAVLPPGLMMAGAGLLAAATAAGARLARRRPGQQQIWLGTAAGALLVIAALHVLPDAWSQARAAGIWPWAVPLAAAGTFLLTALAERIGCTCGRDTRPAGGTGAAAALGIHRFLEGPAMVLIASVTVVAALAVHALGKGLAIGALLHAHPRRRVGILLAAMCASPVIGGSGHRCLPVP